MYKLTKEDLAFLRKADTLTFRASFFDDGSDKSCIVAGKGKIAQQSEVTMEIPCESRVTNYASKGEEHPPGLQTGCPRYCYESSLSAQYDHALRTALEVIKPGDWLELHWILANNTVTLGRAGLVADELRLLVYRESRVNKHPLTFQIGYRVTPIHSSARMATF